MAFSDFRDTHSWKGAVELGPHLARLADELPAGEQMGLALQLREGMVHLVAGIGLDLLDGSQFTRRRHAVRLLAVLDLIDHVYPALDTGAARDGLEKLLARLTGPDFDEHKGKPRSSAMTARPQAAPDGHGATAHPAATHAAPHPAPESIPVIPDASASVPGPSAPIPGSRPVPQPTDDAADLNPALKVAVHPDSDSHQEA